MASKANEEFALRLRNACDQHNHVPPLYQGRQVWLAERLGVSKEAARKWLFGYARPRHGLMIRLADLLGVQVEWLEYGIEDMPSPREREEADRLAGGAEQYVSGLIHLLGGRTAYASEEEREAGVHFHAIIKGSMHKIRVAYGELDGNEVEFRFPARLDGLMVVGVATIDPESPAVVVFDQPEAEELSEVRGVRRMLRVEAQDAHTLTTAGHVWPSLGCFLNSCEAA